LHWPKSIKEEDQLHKVVDVDAHLEEEFALLKVFGVKHSQKYKYRSANDQNTLEKLKFWAEELLLKLVSKCR
jgi:hypothetical protein